MIANYHMTDETDQIWYLHIMILYLSEFIKEHRADIELQIDFQLSIVLSYYAQVFKRYCLLGCFKKCSSMELSEIFCG